MPPVDDASNILVPRVSYSNGLTYFSFIRELKTSDTTQDIDLTVPRFFFYGSNGTARFADDNSLSSIGQHREVPMISNERVFLGTPSQCPGKYCVFCKNE